jgi:FlaA1/EpsC-like NDP-sugar epimerase
MRNRYIFLLDLLLAVVAAFSAFALRLGWFFESHLASFRFFLGASVIVRPIVFWVFGMYREYWRYASIRELVVVVLSVSASSVLLVVVVASAMMIGWLEGFPRSVLMLDWLIMLMFAGGVRLSVRLIGESRSRRRPVPDSGDKRVLVFGAGDAGSLVVREMQRNPQLRMRPVAFADDDASKRRNRIHRVPVLGGSDDLPALVAAHRIDEVIIAIPRAGGRAVRAVMEQCRRANVPSRTMPGIFELLDGNVSVSRLRRVEIADLLRREPVEITRDTEAYVSGKTVLVTGAGGSIGSELCRQVAHAKPRMLVMLGHGENALFEAHADLARLFPTTPIRSVVADIRHRDRLLRVFEHHKPHVVFHAAGHKHVPLMEDNVEEAITTNLFGTANVLDAAVFVGSDHFVLISTDKAVYPTSVMGASKRMAEMIVQEAARRSGRPFSVVRFGNVLGSRGSVVPILTKQIEQGVPVTLTHPDMTRFFMTIPEAVHLVLHAGGMGQGVFVLNMGDPVRLVDLVDDLIRLSGLSTDEVPIHYVGMRPGERLHEMLWEPDADIHITENPDIKRVLECSLLTDDRLANVLRQLRAAVEQGNDLQIRAVLADALPSFASDIAESMHVPMQVQ